MAAIAASRSKPISRASEARSGFWKSPPKTPAVGSSKLRLPRRISRNGPPRGEGPASDRWDEDKRESGVYKLRLPIPCFCFPLPLFLVFALRHDLQGLDWNPLNAHRLACRDSAARAVTRRVS